MAVKLADRLAKTGKDLFIELVRVYSVAEVDDYFKGGLWQDDVMKAHIEIIDRHRREAGAPQIPDLSEVEKTVLKAIPAIALNAKSAVPKAATPWAPPKVPKVAVEPGMEVTPPAEAEQRLIALFIKKHSLDEAAATEVINKRPYHQRRHIYGKFKAENTGEEGAKDLVKFCEECDKDKTWPAPPAAAAIPAIAKAAGVPAISPAATAMMAALKAMPAAQVAAAGIKRPAAMMSGGPAMADPNKSARTNAMAMALAQQMAGGARAPNIAIRAPSQNPAQAAMAALAKLASGITPLRPGGVPAWRPGGPKPAGARPHLIVPQAFLKQ
jgi:hypothetical protein